LAIEYKRIDVDSHIQEMADTWTNRLSRAQFGDRIPHVAEVDGREVWVIDGVPLNYLSTCPAVMPDRVSGPLRWSEIPAGVYRARERLAYMDQDGIDCQVMYANISGVSGGTFQGKDPEYEAACVRAYNDLQTEEWLGTDPGRFVALTIPPHSSMARTLAEVSRCHEAGHRGVILFGTPHLRGLPNYSDRYWDPLWATCQERGIVINMHGSGEAPRSMRIMPPEDTEHRRAAASQAAAGFSIQPQYFANFLFAGVLDRFPDLLFVGAESGIGWLPWLLEACDHAWETGRLWDRGLPNRPSDVFHRQCYVDFWYEVSAIQSYRYVIGVDRIMWETDFPHPTALWPNTAEFLARALEGVPEDEQRLILAENAKRVYKLGEAAA
jgi:predicted TIM-barrel fold metal-dependent hydrolase